MTIRPFRDLDAESAVDLWRQCNLVSATNDPYKDIARKLKSQPDSFLVAAIGDEIVGTVMCGYEGHRGWINYLAVSPHFRRKGVGRQLMDAAEKLLRSAGCPKINLQVRSSNQSVVAFYRSIGFAVDDVVSMGKRLEVD